MIMSPVNPSDLLVVRGRYGVLPTLPATPGFEGVGVVDEVGPGLLGRLVKGKRVVAINQRGRELGRVRGDPRPAGAARARTTSPTSRRRPISSTRRPSWPWRGTS